MGQTSGGVDSITRGSSNQRPAPEEPFLGERAWIVTNAEGVVQRVSERAATMFGLTVGLSLATRMLHLGGRVPEYSLLGLDERCLRLEDGRALWFRPVGSPERLFEVIDISALMGLQIEVASETLGASLAALAAQVASDLSNPATVMEGRIAMALELSEDDAVSAQLEVALSHAQSVAETARALRLVGHRSLTTAESSSLREIVDAAWAAAQPRMRGGTLTSHIGSPIRVGVRASPLVRALAHLFLSLGDGPRRALHARCEKCPDGVTLTIVREGKAGSSGAQSLALSVVESLVSGVGGSMEGVSTHEGRGVMLTMPHPSRALARARRACATVLVVGSSRLPDRLASILEPEGFVIEWSPDGIDALRRLQTEQFSGVITELNLHGSSGYSLARAISADAGPPVVILAHERMGPIIEGATVLVPPLSRRRLLPALGRRVRT